MKALYVVKRMDIEKLPKDVVKTKFITLPRWKVEWLLNHRFVFYDQSLDYEDITAFEGMVLGSFLPYSVEKFNKTYDDIRPGTIYLMKNGRKGRYTALKIVKVKKEWIC